MGLTPAPHQQPLLRLCPVKQGLCFLQCLLTSLSSSFPLFLGLRLRLWASEEGAPKLLGFEIPPPNSNLFAVMVPNSLTYAKAAVIRFGLASGVNALVRDRALAGFCERCLQEDLPAGKAGLQARICRCRDMPDPAQPLRGPQHLLLHPN